MLSQRLHRRPWVNEVGLSQHRIGKNLLDVVLEAIKTTLRLRQAASGIAQNVQMRKRHDRIRIHVGREEEGGDVFDAEPGAKVRRTSWRGNRVNTLTNIAEVPPWQSLTTPRDDLQSFRPSSN